MSLRFSGWRVHHGRDSPRAKLGPAQAPTDRGLYTMFHGTSVSSARLIIANGFNQSRRGMLGKGVYVSRDRTKAERYPLRAPDSDRVVLELHVRVGRVKRIDKDNHPLQYNWSEHGYDTAWVPPRCGMKAVPSGREEDCVFDPQNIQVVAIAGAPAGVRQQLVAAHRGPGVCRGTTLRRGAGAATKPPACLCPNTRAARFDRCAVHSPPPLHFQSRVSMLLSSLSYYRPPRLQEQCFCGYLWKTCLFEMLVVWNSHPQNRD